jgi:hypothetical protein
MHNTKWGDGLEQGKAFLLLNLKMTSMSSKEQYDCVEEVKLIDRLKISSSGP